MALLAYRRTFLVVQSQTLHRFRVRQSVTVSRLLDSFNCVHVICTYTRQSLSVSATSATTIAAVFCLKLGVLLSLQQGFAKNQGYLVLQIYCMHVPPLRTLVEA